MGHDVEARKRDGRRDPQPAGQCGAHASRGEIRLLGLLDRTLGMLVEALPRFRRAQSMRRAHQQTDAEALLDLSDRFRDRWLADAQYPRRAGEGAGFDHADKHFHGGQAIHDYLLIPFIIAILKIFALRPLGILQSWALTSARAAGHRTPAIAMDSARRTPEPTLASNDRLHPRE